MHSALSKFQVTETQFDSNVGHYDSELNCNCTKMQNEVISGFGRLDVQRVDLLI